MSGAFDQAISGIMKSHFPGFILIVLLLPEIGDASQRTE